MQKVVLLLIRSLARDFKCVQLCGTSYIRVHCSVYRSPKLNRDFGNYVRIGDFGHYWIK